MRIAWHFSYPFFMEHRKPNNHSQKSTTINRRLYLRSRREWEKNKLCAWKSMHFTNVAFQWHKSIQTYVHNWLIFNFYPASIVLCNAPFTTCPVVFGVRHFFSVRLPGWFDIIAFCESDYSRTNHVYNIHWSVAPHFDWNAGRPPDQTQRNATIRFASAKPHNRWIMHCEIVCIAYGDPHSGLVAEEKNKLGARWHQSCNRFNMCVARGLCDGRWNVLFIFISTNNSITVTAPKWRI